jgi:anti-sigma B factor antagonist
MTQVRRQKNVTVVELDAEYDALDQARFEHARELLLAEAQTVQPPLMALDLSKTAYMGSAFIEVIFRAWKRLRQRGGRLVLCGLQPFCADVLRATRLDTIFDSYANAEDAIAALNAP